MYVTKGVYGIGLQRTSHAATAIGSQPCRKKLDLPSLSFTFCLCFYLCCNSQIGTHGCVSYFFLSTAFSQVKNINVALAEINLDGFVLVYICIDVRVLSFSHKALPPSVISWLLPPFSVCGSILANECKDIGNLYTTILLHCSCSSSYYYILLLLLLGNFLCELLI